MPGRHVEDQRGKVQSYEPRYVSCPFDLGMGEGKRKYVGVPLTFARVWSERASCQY